jgi:hypothetical protein
MFVLFFVIGSPRLMVFVLTCSVIDLLGNTLANIAAKPLCVGVYFAVESSTGVSSGASFAP